METESLTMDAEEQAMRDLGQATDQNEGRTPTQDQSAETAEPRAPAEAQKEEVQQPQPPETERPEQQPDSSETTPTAQEQLARDIETGRFTKREKPDTEYSRAQKEEARKERSWQALQAEKEQFRQMTSQWEEQNRMAQLEAARRNYQPLKQEGLTAQEYYEGARRFEQEGDHENALKAYKVASQLGQAEQGRMAQMQELEAEYQWRMGMQEASKTFPHIWDPNHPITGHLERIISENPWIYRVPQGFQRATEVADMLSKMGMISELQDENVKLRAELEKHQHKGQPARGGFASPRLGEKDFDEMSLDEMEAHLKGVTAEADNYR